MPHREPGEDTVFLKNNAAIGAGAFDFATIEQYAALGGLQETGQQIHERGLAAARRPDDGNKLALVQVESHMVEHAHRALLGGELHADAIKAYANLGCCIHAIRSCQATKRAVSRRSNISITKAMVPIEIMPT